ncbi:MAG: bifunctional 2-methylcitrate synthase/citrate synthase [Bdellovibrionales bacterium]|nr:bifunctional 2-methylcitrate synthase/citrate synthase [Bdellovibrionales bacterium]
MNQSSKGLAGVIVDETKISKVIPESSELLYRGYLVSELVEKCSFEEVVYLLWEGEIPTEKQLENFKKQERKKRPLLDRDVIQILEKLQSAHPMDSIRTLISYWASRGYAWDSNTKERKQKALRFLAAAPVFIAAHFRLRNKLQPISPDNKLSFSENFLKMCFGEIPSQDIVRIFDKTMVLYAEHGFNASTFSARVIASTTSDVGSAITGAIGALKGPLHGGANERVMEMMKEINNPKKAESYILKLLLKKEKIMGFGHRVYRKQDSRVPSMESCARSLSQIKQESKWMEIYDNLVSVMKREKNIYPNVDLPAGPVYYLMGFDIDMFTPFFVMSRIAGWSTHIIEQGENNRIIRPLSNYTGYERRLLSK